jgi:hypothetical protein
MTFDRKGRRAPGETPESWERLQRWFVAVCVEDAIGFSMLRETEATYEANFPA